MTNILCIYHGNCADGFGAAWAVWKRFPDAQFHPGVYGEAPPNVDGMDVVLVDFSYKKDVLGQIKDRARSVLILDHHKSAFEDLCDYKRAPETWDEYYDQMWNNLDHMQWEHRPFIRALFDMERSGAMIAFQFFHPGVTVPAAIEHIQDRDLWRFEKPNTREFQAALFSYPYEFELWNKLIMGSTQPLINDGIALERKHFKDVKELLKVTSRQMRIGEHMVWVANLPYTMASDACHEMCYWPLDKEGEILTPFAASYYDTEDGRVFSLRSNGEFDVSEIAKEYGGGGHKNAAGFKMPIGWEGRTMTQDNEMPGVVALVKGPDGEIKLSQGFFGSPVVYHRHSPEAIEALDRIEKVLHDQFKHILKDENTFGELLTIRRALTGEEQ